MRKKSPSPADSMGEVDEFADESLDGIWIEPITSISSASRQPGHSAAEGSAIAPGWRKRLSTRGKAARALVTALVVIAALVVLLPNPIFTLPPGVARHPTLAPVQTPLPGKFSTGEWEPVARPPVQTAYFYNLVPSPSKPDTAYACLFLEPAGNSSAAQLWVTRDAGYTWRRANLPTVTGSSCTVSPALDGSHRVSLSVDNSTLDQNAQPCDRNQYLLSEDDGASWRLIQHASILPVSTDGGACQLWPTARRLFMWSYSYTGSGNAFLERSDDDGRTWMRADRGLAGLNTFWYPQLLDASGDTIGALVGATPDLWITRNAGASWQRIGPIIHTIGGIQVVVSDLVTEASFGPAPRTCRCAFAVSSPGFLGVSAGRQIFISRDYTHWSPLPPIPVEGASASRSGVFQVLGPAADGRLLALGAEPDAGVSAPPDRTGIVTGPPPRLWDWNTQTGRWELAGTPIPCENHQRCNIFPNGASAVIQADGALLGTMVWLTVVKGAGENQHAIGAAFRLFIPAS
ncbi:MAG TPA: hypothetical protein VH349_06385 [Ktedonobacterales bacterium]|jgi:hypothetical protein